MTKVTRRSVITGAAASAIVSAADARPVFFRGGAGAGVTPQTTITTFQLVEHSGVTSLGYRRVGVGFAPGDMPSGFRPKLLRGGVPVRSAFVEPSRRDDGSVRHCTLYIADTDFAPAESRTYTIVAEAGPWATAPSGTIISDITGGATDFNIAFTTLSGSTSGSLPDHISSFNTLAANPARVLIYDDCDIATTFLVWGYASNGGVPHAHLKTRWWLTAWKNSSGVIFAYEPKPVISQSEWAVPGKEKLSYTATLKNGAITIQAYGGSINSAGVRSTVVEHPYGAEWCMVRLQDDHENGAPHWVGANRPTLHYVVDREYWTQTGLMPPLNRSYAFVMPPEYSTGNAGYGVYRGSTFQPCSAQSHRPGIDAPAGYPGRGAVTNQGAIAFLNQTPTNARIRRNAGHVGLHVPWYHNRTPTDTIFSLKLQDSRGSATPASAYDFTADGMPAAVNAYYDTRSLTANKAGYVNPSGGTDSGTSIWDMKGDTVPQGDAAHAVSYSYDTYLFEPEPYFLEAILDLGINCAQQRIGDLQGGMPAINWWLTSPPTALYPGAGPTPQYTGIAVRAADNGETRIMSLAVGCISGMCLVPDRNRAANFVKAYLKNNMNYLLDSIALCPASAKGTWGPGLKPLSPYLDCGMGTINLYTAASRTGDSGWRDAAEFLAYGPRQWVAEAQNYVAGANSYHIFARPDHHTNWNAATNDWFGKFFTSNDGNGAATSGSGADIDASTNILTQQFVNLNPCGTTLPTNGDQVVLGNYGDGLAYVPPPAGFELVLGQIYYVINASGRTFQLSTTPGGPAIDFAANHTDVPLGWRMQGFSTIADTNLLGPDSYLPIAFAAMAEAIRQGHPDITQTMMDRYKVCDDAIKAGPYSSKNKIAVWSYDQYA